MTTLLPGPFRAILFDLDGTLANTLPLCIEAFRGAIEPVAGRALSDAEIIATFGPSEEGTIRALAPARYDECLAAYLRHYEAKHADYPAVFDGMAELLRDLRLHGVRLGMVTGKGVASARLSLRQFGLEDVFEVVETGSPLGPRKAEALRDVLAAWQLAAAEAVYIGDAPSDITAARAVGMPIVSAAWADTADAATLQAMGPDLLAHSVGELRDWLWPRLHAGAAPDGMWLGIAQRLQALAQAGLAYDPHVFDAERYQEVLALSQQMLSHLTGQPVPQLQDAIALERGYPTPKVDIRAVLFNGTDQVLMAREKHDGGKWSLPGGWADVGCTPFEVAVKEVREETGLDTEAVRLLALWDKRVHPHPPQAWYVYKAFILCRPTGGALLADTAETTEVRWVSRHELPALDLSTDRVTLSQLERLFDFAANPDLPTLCD
ncbi:NUDIX hydrolase N-terminal domain-containing protein [Massilia sp. METH4]|uniref:NUDIX hydrolase N-terminal domain-containing protein n=1 Tax=Massilia sp. METH4 TaxID=3123041 RepID=UPI0030D5D6D5